MCLDLAVDRAPAEPLGDGFRSDIGCFTQPRGIAGLVEAIVATIRDVTKLRGEVELAAPGSLPNDGKVIEDLRKYG